VNTSAPSPVAGLPPVISSPSGISVRRRLTMRIRRAPSLAVGGTQTQTSSARGLRLSTRVRRGVAPSPASLTTQPVSGGGASKGGAGGMVSVGGWPTTTVATPKSGNNTTGNAAP
jgi:hypothetical protein